MQAVEDTPTLAARPPIVLLSPRHPESLPHTYIQYDTAACPLLIINYNWRMANCRPRARGVYIRILARGRFCAGARGSGGLIVTRGMGRRIRNRRTPLRFSVFCILGRVGGFYSCWIFRRYRLCIQKSELCVGRGKIVGET